MNNISNNWIEYHKSRTYLERCQEIKQLFSDEV